MYEVSAAFAAAMENRPYVARLKLDGNEVIEGNAIQSMIFRGGTNGDQNAFTLGGTVSSSVEILLHKDHVSYSLCNRKIKVELGMELSTGTEWLPMGVYFATDPLADDDLLTVTALDALGSKFEKEYEPIPGFEFGTDTGISSTAFLSALCARRGVTVDVANLAAIQLKAPPDGFTERQIIGFIAALYGGFADIDRAGILRIRSYSECAVKVTADEYYEGGMEKADYDFSVQWLKCYNESTDLTMFVGDLDAEQGIYLESIWMNYTILNDLLDKLQGFSYRPVTELSFLGNPLIDPGDIITMEDLEGESIKIPVMNISHEYDGGILTRVTATGQAKTEGYTNSTQREIRRANASAKKYTDTENEKLNQLELLKRLTKEWMDDGIYLTEDGKIAFKASAILTGVLMASLIQTGILQSKDGKTFYLDLDNGILRMQATEFSVSGKTVEQIAEGKAGEAVKAQTQQDIFNKLTNNGTLKGIFMHDGELCVSASAILTGILKGVEIIGEFGTIGGFTMSDHTLSAVFRKDYPAFTQADLEKAVAYRVGSTTLTAEEIEKYDVNMTGDVDTADVSTMQGMMEGTVPTYSEGRIILDATNPKETIVLEVTAGYRAGERLALGMGLAKATKFIADTFACGADNGYTGTVTAGDKTLTIKGGIITSVS